MGGVWDVGGEAVKQEPECSGPAFWVSATEADQAFLGKEAVNGRL